MSEVFTEIMDCILAVRYRASDPQGCDDRSEGLEAKCANFTNALVKGFKERPDVITLEMLQDGNRINSEILRAYAITAAQSDGFEKIYQAVKLALLLDDSPPLSKNDVAILSEMAAMGANSDAPKTSRTILSRLKWVGEGKRAFDNLKTLGYVKSAGKKGYFLTEPGASRSSKLQ